MDMTAVQNFLSTTVTELAIKILAAIAFWIVGRWLIGKVIGLGWPYFIGVGIACGIALFHYTLIRGRDREQCFKAFLHNNWLGFTLWCGVMFDYAVRT